MTSGAVLPTKSAESNRVEMMKQEKVESIKSPNGYPKSAAVESIAWDRQQPTP